MNKLYCVLIVLVLTACQSGPQPVPPASATAPVVSTTRAEPTPSATPTASPAPTTAPTVAPTTPPTAAPTLAPTTLPTPTPTTTPLLRAQVDSPDVGYLNVRDAPSASGALVTQVKDGALLDVLDAADTARGQIGQQGQWLKVRTSDGKEGFVAAWYLRLPGTNPAPTFRPTATPAPPELAGAALELFNRTNALRAQNGLAAYRFAERLSAAAQRQSDDMANTGNVSHTGSDGSTVQQRVLDTGYGDWPVAENIFGGAAILDDAWQSWTTEPAYRDNLLSQKFRNVGFAVTKGKGDVFYFTMVFGARPPQPEPAPTLAPTSAAGPSTDAVLNLLNRTNALRASNGLPAYRLNDKLNASAQRHSQDMANTSNIDHTGSDGSTARRRILDTGYEAQFTGENIYGGMATVDDAWDYWVNDPPHRDILLNKLYVDIGISVVKGKGETYYYTMDLARPSAP